jgi:MerR family mercuric resistance operon transcriptional regulator
MAHLTIGKLAAEAGVNVETVRYYQRIGLLAEPEKDGGVRHYGEPHLARLRFIRRGKDAGFSLDEVRELLNLDEVSERDRIRELAGQRLHVIEARIADMQQLAGQLQELIRQCERTAEGSCCPIIETFS